MRFTNPLRRFKIGNTAPLIAERERLQSEEQRLKQALKQRDSHILQLQKRGFAAAQVSRLFADLTGESNASINQLLERELVIIRTRSRKLARDDDYAKKFISMVVNNVVGPDGFKLELDIKDDNGKVDQKAVDQIKLAWDKWCKKKNASVTRGMSYHDIDKLTTSTSPASGGFLVRKVRGFDNPFKYALQVIATDCLDETKNKAFDGTSSIRMGVERDSWGAVIFYHIKTENPYDVGYNSRQNKTERVPAKEILHAFIPMEVDQARELPWFHSSMIGLQMLGGYNEAALVAARVGAQKMGFLKRMPDANGNYTGDGQDSDGNRIMDSAPGQIEELPSGFDFAAWDPKYPHSEHGSFNKCVLRGLAAGLIVSYNSLANDLEGVNFSSIRAGLLDERDQWKMLQQWKRENLHNPVFEDWLEMAMLTGEVNLPRYKFDKFNRPCFMGRRWPWVDPKNDIEAAVLAIKHRLGSMTDFVAEGGGSIEELFATIENEQKMLKERGIKLPEDLEMEIAQLKVQASEKAAQASTAKAE